jgi:hypothetical protein
LKKIISSPFPLSILLLSFLFLSHIQFLSFALLISPSSLPVNGESTRENVINGRCWLERNNRKLDFRAWMYIYIYIYTYIYIYIIKRTTQDIHYKLNYVHIHLRTCYMKNEKKMVKEI